ncbi:MULTISPECIES: ABC transporter ATP-binding protein [unclassified Treponema]|uniref:ABC transporter ATP-binding protein n=1 Tax=unclassified Treponema TaxID=2638727 RepID=UPI0020A2B27A|nr:MULTISPECIES: ABC transporter ATP-binding protein [unclassified Treponema]UTC66193.1 ABC transporter ATP-binding protein [Treponema sp. OMZ 789]UTC68922.1 ABC transporter ATP-binding protein [Treponema sp. OMZ 790]UTC71650.1 ABC transporter ATP-binding protein [Treponema sp. OMZ 791]
MFKIQKEAGDIFKSIRFKRMFGGLFLLSDEFLTVVPGYYIGLAVDELKNSTMTQSSLIAYVLKIIFFTCLGYFFSAMFMFFIHNSGNKASYLFRKKILSSVLKKTPPFFKKYTSGDILARTSNDVIALENYFSLGFIMMMDSFAYPGVAIFMMSVLISWKLTVAVVLPIPLITLIYFSLGKTIKDRTSKSYAEFSKVNQGILELAEGIKLIRCYVNEQVRLKKLSSIVKNYFSVLYAQVKLTSLLQPCTVFITNLCIIIAFCYGGYLVHAGEITSGNLVSFFVFVGMIAWSGIASGFYLQLQKSGEAAIDRINALIKDNNEFPPMDGKTQIEKVEKISFKNFSFAYSDSEKKVLQDVSLEVSQGQILGITGKTGSGKTSLIKQFFSLYPQNENIFINNLPLKDCDVFSFRNKTVYVSQRPELLSGTVCENLCFYTQNIEKEKILKVLETADVKSDIEKLANGIDSKIGEKGVMLSGGQRQRIALARALLKEPQVLILDDAISAVDADTEVKIIENLKKSSSFNICIISAHRLSAVQHADKIIVLDEGKIIQQGTHEELIKAGGWYAEQFEYQHSHSAELIQKEDSYLQIDKIDGGKNDGR